MSKRDQKRKDDWQASLELPDHRQPTPEYELPQGFEEKPPEKRQGSSHAHTSKAERQEIFIPVSGFVWLYPEEIPVINHPTFQRLGRIYQLGQTFVVYRGATHKRLEHALGTLQLAQRMIDAISHTSKKGLGRGEPCGTSLSACEQRFVRLGALLHDIGHMAAGHTVEDELGLVGRHDSDARLDLIFEGTEWADAEGRTLAALIDAEFQKYVPPALSNIKASTILRLLVRKVPDDIENDRLAESQNLLEESSDPRLNICRDMIGNTICADLLDYIHRDWYHVGKPRPFDDRIFQYMEVRNTGSVARGGKPTPHPRDQFVISLGRRPKIRTDAVSAILELLEWRYQLTESVLFHRTKLAAAAMLDRALFALWGGSSDEVEQMLLPLSDEQMLATCKELAKKREEKARSEGERERAATAARLLKALERRELFKDLSTRFYDELPGDVRSEVERTYGRTSNGRDNSAPENRWRVLQVLESDFSLPLGSLAMYCPTEPMMNAKIAEVRIAVENYVEKFSEYEDKHGDHLSGGHLKAQLRRFQRLWRVHFFIDGRVREQRIAVISLLQRAIEKLVLGHRVEYDENVNQMVHSLAVELIHTKGSPWYGREIVDRPPTAAYQQPETATGDYPFGAPSIRSFISTPKPEQ